MSSPDEALSPRGFGALLGAGVKAARGILKALVPVRVRRWYWHWPPPGWVRFGSLRRVTPICRDYGYSRGGPIDRYYIENFLAANSADIRGRVLEIGDNSYTLRFGGDRVTRSDVLHIEAGNPQATIIGDLADAPHIPAETFDCIVLTETLYLIYDFHAALRTLHRILKPGGVLLATFPGMSHQICRAEADRWGDYWRFTSYSARRFLAEVFPPETVQVTAFGNVLVAISFLHGLSASELKKEELDYHDHDYEFSIAVRAVK
ncbi:MAG TPA: methyltransferase domain-containing protein [Blastocatellia bacterium]|nr:methyltransferase domain-containing protein [Blastocatellia bacterium]